MAPNLPVAAELPSEKHENYRYRPPHRHCLRDSISHSLLGEFTTDERTFRVGILTESLEDVGGHAVFISNPASSCVVTAIALCGSNNENETAKVRNWCRRNMLAPVGTEANITAGEASYQMMLSRADVDAVYIAVPCLRRKDYLSRALIAKKHVLVDYPVCAAIPEFLEMIKLAHRYGVHIQDSTMFIHHHRISELLECVFDEENFGKVKCIHETLCVNQQVPDPVTMKTNPEWKEQGCVGTLARFCIMFGLLVFDRMKLKARTVQATRAVANHEGAIEEVVCKVDFDEGRNMIIDCNLVTGNSTRQHVEVESESRTASMINFVYPQASISSYRLYETSTTKQVVSGDSIDIEGGPPQAVMMWRRFADMCQVIDRGETTIVEEDEHITIDNPREFTNVMLETLNVVTALMQSIREGGNEVTLDEVEAPA